jgi:hypothetical protein
MLGREAEVESLACEVGNCFESLAIRIRKPEFNHGAKASKELVIFQ